MERTGIQVENKQGQVSLAPTSGVLQRQCACGTHTMGGGQCADCAKSKSGLQRKLAIGASHDPLEQEADRVADQVMAATANPTVNSTPPRIQRFTGQATGENGTAPASVDRVLANSGRTLDPALQQDMEQRFGHDFSRVRVHTGGAAEQSARDVNAHAYTVGHDMVFGAGQFAPSTLAGRHLLAHELTHVVQQSAYDANAALAGGNSGLSQNATAGVSRSGSAMIMRKGFESTVEICHRVLETRKFEVQNGGLRVVLAANSPDSSVPNCRDFDFGVTLNRSEDWWPDKEIGTCEASTGGTRVFTFGNLPTGTYYLTIWRTFDHPYCCLEGDIMVFDEAVADDSSGCLRAKDLSTMDIVHAGLDLAGFIPVLGAIPDGINAGIYVVEGDWANAGLSAVAMVPAWGDGVKLGVMAGKSAIKVTAKAATKLGPKGIAEGLKEVKAVSKAAKTVDAAKDAAKLERELAEQLGKKEAQKLEADAAEAAKKESGTTDKGKKKEKEKEGKKGKWGCNDVRCNVYPNPQANPPNKDCPERVIGAVPYIFPSFDAACKAAQVAANLLVPLGCIKRHCNCETKCTRK